MSNENEIESMTPFDPFDEAPMPVHSVPPVTKPAHHRRSLPGAVHHALRGRYWIAAPLVLIGAVGAAYFGWVLPKPLYKSEGLVRIQYQLDSPFMREQSRFGEGIPLYEEHLATETTRIMSRSILDLAFQDKAWLATGIQTDSKMLKKFVENLVVEHPRATEYIRIAHSDEDPSVAQAAVGSIIRAYEKMYIAGDKSNQEKRLSVLQSRLGALHLQIEGEKKSIGDIAAEYGTDDFTAIYQNKQLNANTLDRRLSEAKLRLALRAGKADVARTVDKMSLDQIAIIDAGMSRKMEAYAQADSDVHRLEGTLGDQNQKVKEAKRVREAGYTAAEDYAKSYREFNINAAADSESRGGLDNRSNQSKESLQTEVASLTKMFEEATEEMKSVGNKLRDIERHKDKVKDLLEETRSYEHDKQMILDENKVDGRLKVLSYGEVPIGTSKDRRIPMAIAAGLGGGALPILLFMLLAKASTRFRYSDEADIGDGMPPLLGILPMLPDRLSDPEQAAVAAHCIHQLRIMLQVNGGSDRKVLLVTSASAGDGKTSLTMALGLSYAASGSRTLVIDGDMIGQGLTARLKARQSPGLLESLSAGTLNGRVKKTTTPNLFILPIGCAESAHAGGLSPVSIRKLLTEARRVFDTVIIDTGPILGSLEATVIAAAADSVLLTLARGQHRSLVDRSVRQLRQLGANVAGLVFNRAEKRDFQRSVGSSSIRSIGHMPTPHRLLAGDGTEESRFGPLARSVASFMPMEPAPKPVAPGNGETRIEVISKTVEASVGSPE